MRPIVRAWLHDTPARRSSPGALWASLDRHAFGRPSQSSYVRGTVGEGAKRAPSGAGGRPDPLAVGHSAPRAGRGHARRRAGRGRPIYVEAARLIQRRFDAQNLAKFVVHFYGVFGDPVFDAHPLDAALDARGDLGRVRRARPAEKAQDVWRMEVLKGVGDQRRIYRLQTRAVAKQDIGCVFAFVQAPVVRPELMPAEQGIDPRGKHAEHTRPRPR